MDEVTHDPTKVIVALALIKLPYYKTDHPFHLRRNIATTGVRLARPTDEMISQLDCTLQVLIGSPFPYNGERYM
jgi:hypothetical protein